MPAFRTPARLSTKSAALTGAVLGAGLLLAGPASAHVGISPGDAHAGSYTVATVSVPHGCDGSATTKIAIKIPEELLSVTPTRNPSYDVTKKFVKLAAPATDKHGNEVTERVDQVVYTARSPLPDGYRDTFELSFQVPDVAGKTIYFPTIQTCEKGQTAWVEIAPEGAEEPEHPAPSLAVLPAEEGDEHGASVTTASIETAAAKTDDDSSALAATGLAAGVIGLGLGGTALLRTRRKS